MSTFTKEQLMEKLQHRISVSSGFPESEKAQMDLELARIALASLKAEPVAYTEKCEITNMQANGLYLRGFPDNSHGRDIALFTAPPAPVSLPDESAVELLATDLMKRIDKITGERHSVATLSSLRVSIVESCLAAMLQGAEPVTTAYKSPDSWMACRDQNPEKGRHLALFGKRTKENCDPYVDEGYLGSDGEFYFFDWEGGPRINDCHPYDKAEVTHWMYRDLPAAPQQEVK